MYFIEELSALEERMFPEELLESILSAYWSELEAAGDTGCEAIYRSVRAGLAVRLSREQQVQLEEMERLRRENLRYALRFGFTRGLYSGFGQWFVPTDQPERYFWELVEQELLETPAVQQGNPYWVRRATCEMLESSLGQQAGEEVRDKALPALAAAWEDRLLAVLRYAFYLGYRYGVQTVGAVEQPGAEEQMGGQILRTEYALGFIRPRMEQEKQGDMLPLL